MFLSAILCLATGVGPALPHDPGLSSLRVLRTAEVLTVDVAFANADFAGATAIDRDADGFVSAAELEGATALLEAAVFSDFVLRSAAVELRPVLLRAALAKNDDVELRLQYNDAPADGVLTVGFLDKLSRGHRCYASVVGVDGAIQSDALLSPMARHFAVPATEVAATGFGQGLHFVMLGAEHILLGFDHLAFLLALLLAGVTLRRAVATITAFTVAHSVTLLLASMGFVGLPGLFVESVIAFSIVWVAVMNLLPGQKGAAHRWPWAFGFGLVHGFGFAGVLADLDIGGPDMWLPLLLFNVGVEIGQLLFALAVVPVLWWLTRGQYAQRTRWIGSIGVALAGVFWLAERVLG